MSAPSIEIDTIESSPFMENSYVVHLCGRADGLIVDPGFEPELIVLKLEQRSIEPAMVLLTHGHADHIAGNAYFKTRWPDVPLVIGAGDAHMLTDPLANLSGLGGEDVCSPPADRLVEEGEIIEAAGIALEVLDLPGHSSGHVVYLIKQVSPYLVLGGDVLFQGSVGRVDFPGGSGRQLLTNIRTKLFTLPDDTIVYPGHGPITTIGQEKRTNPFCGENAGLVDLN